VDVIILAAGYGTRLEREINQDTSGKFFHLKGVPKPLLPVGGKPLIDYWIDDLKKCSDLVNNIYVVSNAHFYDLFVNWAKVKEFPVNNVVKDDSTVNGNRLGAVADLCLVLEEKKVNSEILVIAGDTLFLREFDLRGFINHFYKLNADANLICYYVVPNHNEVSKRGVIELNENNQVTKFLEKPKPETTNSDFAVPPLYLYRKETIQDIKDFVHKHTKTRDERDAPGLFVAYIYSKKPIFATEIPGRFDVGGLEDYEQANEYFERKGKL